MNTSSSSQEPAFASPLRPGCYPHPSAVDQVLVVHDEHGSTCAIPRLCPDGRHDLAVFGMVNVTTGELLCAGDGTRWPLALASSR